MVEPVSIEVSGNVEGSIVVGDHNFVVNNNHGTIVYQQAKAQVLARSFAPQPPRAPRGFINRTAELTKLEGWIAANQVVLLHGPDGMGKSALLRQAANSAAAKAMPGGVILLESVDVDGQALGPDDIIQRLFDALFESNPPLKVNVVTARTHLSNTRPLVVMDEVSLPTALQKALPDLFPSGAILLAADAASGAEIERLSIGPLPRAEALALLASRAELTLNQANRATLEKLCALLGDVSLALVVTGNVLRETHTSPEAALQAIQAIQTLERDPALAALNRAFGFAFSRLSPEEQQVLSAAALTPGISMTPEWLSVALGSINVDVFIERLKAFGLLFANSPRLRLPPGFVAPAKRTSVLDKDALMARLIEFLIAPLTENPQNWQYIQAELGNFLGALTWAAQKGRAADVIALGRALDPYLTLHGLWDAWGASIGYVLEAARQSGGKAVEAWALHQLGTRIIGLGEPKQALGFLQQALELRRALGDTTGMAYTQHNINLLIGPPPGSNIRPTPKNSGPNWFLIIGGITLIGLFLLAALIIFGWQFINPLRTPTPSPTQTSINEPPPTDAPTFEVPPTLTESPTLTTTVPTLPATPTPTPPGGGAGQMVFHSGDDNPYIIQRISTDGSNLETILKDAQQPAWSPDGQQIAFIASETGFSNIASPAQTRNNRQVYLLNIADGTIQPVTSTGGDKSHPAWSPDGKRIAFVRFDGDFNHDIYIVDVGGGEPMLLTDTPKINEDNPAWSPDGSQIIYDASYNSIYRQLGIIRADGSSNGVGELLPNPSLLIRRDMVEPAWSPDGKQIAFATNPGSDFFDIYIMNLDGSKLRRLTSEKFAKSDENTPDWSPDGNWIAFTSTINGTRQIFMIKSDGSDVQALLTENIAAWEPDWRP